jgi:prepilin-type N-terminal cleavage/methylation domain-containing protein
VRRPGSRGFTLMELLTVIAIIAILAGLLFPVLARAQRGARQTQCMSNMKSIIQAARMYKEDWRVYPDALYGYGRDLDGNGEPDLIETRLYPEYINDEKIFNCPLAPLNLGNGRMWVYATTPISAVDPSRLYPAFASYDVEFRPNRDAGPPAVGQLRYTRKWTPSDMTGLGDFPRQLIYKNPPDSTVVTWCLYHAEFGPDGPQQGAMAVVGFLSGRVQAIPADQVAFWPDVHGRYPWEVSPKQ